MNKFIYIIGGLLVITGLVVNYLTADNFLDIGPNTTQGLFVVGVGLGTILGAWYGRK